MDMQEPIRAVYGMYMYHSGWYSSVPGTVRFCRAQHSSQLASLRLTLQSQCVVAAEVRKRLRVESS